MNQMYARESLDRMLDFCLMWRGLDDLPCRSLFFLFRRVLREVFKLRERWITPKLATF